MLDDLSCHAQLKTNGYFSASTTSVQGCSVILHLTWSAPFMHRTHARKDARTPSPRTRQTLRASCVTRDGRTPILAVFAITREANSATRVATTTSLTAHEFRAVSAFREDGLGRSSHTRRHSPRKPLRTRCNESPHPQCLPIPRVRAASCAVKGFPTQSVSHQRVPLVSVRAYASPQRSRAQPMSAEHGDAPRTQLSSARNGSPRVARGVFSFLCIVDSGRRSIAA